MLDFAVSDEEEEEEEDQHRFKTKGLYRNLNVMIQKHYF